MLRLDRRLAALLDGVYRPSDMYMRWLERSTAVNFGTRWGRALTLWVTIPFGAAALLLQAIGILVHLFCNPDHHPLTLWIYHVLVGPSREGGAAGKGPHLPWHFLLLGMIGCVLMAVIHAPEVRLRFQKILQTTRQGMRRGVHRNPREFFRQASLQKFLRIAGSFRCCSMCSKPLIVGTIAPGSCLPQPARHSGGGGSILFVVTTVMIQLPHRKGALTEAMAHAVISFVKMLRRRPARLALYRVLMRIFKQVIDSVELVLFTVDDWLYGFRKGDSTGVARGTHDSRRALVFHISYLARFCMVVLIEPGFNPAKAPVSYVAAKVMLPLAPHLTTFMAGSPSPVHRALARLRDCRPDDLAAAGRLRLPLLGDQGELEPVSRQSPQGCASRAHWPARGETVKALLLPGAFHSGTIPRLLYHRLHAKPSAMPLLGAAVDRCPRLPRGTRRDRPFPGAIRFA